MTLQIRDDRARQLAHKLAAKRKVTMTEAVIQALESELRRDQLQKPLSVRISNIAARLASDAGPNRRPITKDEIDMLWGHD